MDDDDRLDDDVEHERKFVVPDARILDGHEGVEIIQAYLWESSGAAIRVRWTQARDDNGRVHDGPWTLTYKGPKSTDGTRDEYEFSIPERMARFIVANEGRMVTKHRYLIASEDNLFEVDRFSGENAGLIIAEFEGSAKAVAFLRKPWWCGEEVTSDFRYNNEQLARCPWQSWPENSSRPGG